MRNTKLRWNKQLHIKSDERVLTATMLLKGLDRQRYDCYECMTNRYVDADDSTQTYGRKTGTILTDKQHITFYKRYTELPNE